jgi:hypothetical protein
MYTYTGYNIYKAHSPCFFTPLADPLLSPFFVPFTCLETLLAVTGSVHLGLRLLINWPPLSQPFPTPSPLQIPSTQVNKRLTMTTSRIRLLLSGTRMMHSKSNNDHNKISNNRQMKYSSKEYSNKTKQESLKKMLSKYTINAQYMIYVNHPKKTLNPSRPTATSFGRFC